jgi:phosphopantothenoylcysteine decarboxylase/phosphopantothenate--cysteine ligase
MPLSGRKILVGVSGGIAAYKVCELVRLLTKTGSLVNVVMTKSATNFVHPQTFETLTGNPVETDLFKPRTLYKDEASVLHVDLARRADLMLIAPATANVIAKMAAGICDDLLSTVYVCFDGPVMIAPAMNGKMYLHPAVQTNLRLLKERGVVEVVPETGDLACGEHDVGRMAEPETIFAAVERHLSAQARLFGKCVVVTAGATREPLDPIRFVSNRSTGFLGMKISDMLAREGADVTLITAHTEATPTMPVKVVHVETAEDLRLACRKHFGKCDALVMTAAVADFRPEQAPEKIRRGGGVLTVKMTPTTDILAELATLKKDQVVVGVSAETSNVLASSAKKLSAKCLDLIVATQVSGDHPPFGSGTMKAALVTRASKGELEEADKNEWARRVVQWLVDRLQ